MAPVNGTLHPEDVVLSSGPGRVTGRTFVEAAVTDLGLSQMQGAGREEVVPVGDGQHVAGVLGPGDQWGWRALGLTVKGHLITSLGRDPQRLVCFV